VTVVPVPDELASVNAPVNPSSELTNPDPPDVKHVEQLIVNVPAEYEEEIGPVPWIVTDEPSDLADEEDPSPNVIELLVRSVFDTDPSTIDVELTEAVVIKPFTSTAKRFALPAAF